MFWFAVQIIAFFRVVAALAPKPQVGLQAQTVTAPTAQEGRPIPVLFGTRDIDGLNCTWYGHITTSAIKR